LCVSMEMQKELSNLANAMAAGLAAPSKHAPACVC